MTDNTPEPAPEVETIAQNEIAEGWQRGLQPAHCPKCEVAHLIPAEMPRAICPACFSAQLAYQPSVLRPEPPELLLDFATSPQQVTGKFQAWLKGVWLRPKELTAAVLASRLTKTFIPMWLVDGGVMGSWQAQMGYDYQVASSQEIYGSGGWHTRKLTETRIRWEPRSGTVEREYDNLAVPALDEHARLMADLGNFRRDSAPEYNPLPLEKASVRIPSLLPEEAWPLAKIGFDQLAAADCQTAADAQHVDEYNLQAEYKNINWTQLLLPVYTTAYRDEDGKIHTVMVNGQTGKIVGVRRISQKRGWYWSGGLIAIAIGCFLLALGASAATAILPFMALVGVILFIVSLAVGIASPIPALWAWNFNRKEKQ